MPARCVVRLQQMRTAGACPSPPGHTRDIMALCGARNVHAHPCMTRSTGRLVAPPVQKATCNTSGLYINSATAGAETAQV